MKNRRCSVTLLHSAILFCLTLTWDANGNGTGQTNDGDAWLGADLCWNGFAKQTWSNQSTGALTSATGVNNGGFTRSLRFASTTVSVTPVLASAIFDHELKVVGNQLLLYAIVVAAPSTVWAIGGVPFNVDTNGDGADHPDRLRQTIRPSHRGGSTLRTPLKTKDANRNSNL